jgi:lysophospholipase L1-like esterase
MTTVKAAKRAVLCLSGTIALTSFLLFAINAYHANQTDSENAAPAGSQEAGFSAGNGAMQPDISSGERHLVYQPQQSASPDGTAADGQNAGVQAEQSSGPDNSGTGNLSGQSNSGTENPASLDGSANQADGQNDSDTGSSSSGKSDKTDSGNSSSDKDDKTDSANADSGKDSKTDSANADSGKDNKDNSSSGGKKKDDSGKKKNSGQDNTFHTVTEDYFSDALFIGDSRTVGMQQSGLLPNATFYAKTGIGIGELLSQCIVNEGGYLISVENALHRHSFGKVYIMIGINDMSMGDTDWFRQQYEKIIQAVRQTQPDAIIYIQGNIPMSYGIQDFDGSLNNRNLRLRDEASRELADSETIFYLDVDTLYADKNGHLASMYTADGLHIKRNYYPLWVDYLEHRAIIH